MKFTRRYFPFFPLPVWFCGRTIASWALWWLVGRSYLSRHPSCPVPEVPRHLASSTLPSPWSELPSPMVSPDQLDLGRGNQPINEEIRLLQLLLLLVATAHRGAPCAPHFAAASDQLGCSAVGWMCCPAFSATCSRTLRGLSRSIFDQTVSMSTFVGAMAAVSTEQGCSVAWSWSSAVPPAYQAIFFCPSPLSCGGSTVLSLTHGHR